MARKQSGGFNKFLNLIGLVDDVDPRDAYADEYTSGNYGRPSGYVPQRQHGARTSMPGGRASQQPAARRSLPAQAGRSNYGGGRAYGGEDYRNGRYASQEYQSGEFDDGYGRESDARSRTRSRFEEEAPRRGAGQEPRVEGRPQRPARISQRQRTVMFSLHALEECCDVIDELIAGNTIILTIDELDGRLMQRAIDTLSGAVFALHAAIRKASDKTYLLAPAGVEVNETYDVDRRF